MQPEYTAYQNSPHSRVECVKCHIGPGAGWFVKSKLSGVGQVVAVTFNTYPRPIPRPVHNLRPARETCEACHWPQKYGEDRIQVITKFADDETNSVTKTVLLMKIGGGNHGIGIHGTHLGPGVSDPLRPLRRSSGRTSPGWSPRSTARRPCTPPPTPSPMGPASACARWTAWTATTVRRTATTCPERGLDKAMAAGLISAVAAVRQEEGARDPQGELQDARRGGAEDSGGLREVLPADAIRPSGRSGRRT